MKYLGLSGVALADKVSALREDGKRTAPETISRWVNGAKPIDPFLMGWITEMVRTQLRKHEKPLIRLPKNSGLIIAVTNFKGGVGTTTVAKSLAVIASLTLGMRATFLKATSPNGKKYSEYELQELHTLRINCPNLELEEILAYQPEQSEIVVVDVSTGVVQQSLSLGTDKEVIASPEAFLYQFRPDVYVVPADFGSKLDIWSTVRLVNSGVMQDPVQLLHLPRLMDMDFGAKAQAEGLDVSSDLFCPFFIPQSHSAESSFPRSSLSGRWQNSDQEEHYYKLFEHLLEFLGGQIIDGSSIQQDIEGMSLLKLLDLAEFGKS